MKEDLQKKLEEESRLGKEIEKESIGRETTEERTSFIERISEQDTRIEKLDSELALFAEFDPEELKKMEDRLLSVRNATNRWVDNIFNCQSHIMKKYSIERKDLNTQFGIPAELDYIPG